MTNMRILTKDTVNNIGSSVVLMGWIDVRRDHGKLIFFDLRDSSGKVQLVVTQQNPELHTVAASLRPEWVVKIEGEVKDRPAEMKNPEHLTGNIEIKVSSIAILSKSETLPIDISENGLGIGEETRLKYRYLDLRRPRMQSNLALRHYALLFIRNYLSEQGFIEIETPILTKTTPEGARDFIVPSRLHNGQFYALPQSPQQYKQLLMVSGFEKYFQIARCFRDEDSRAHRAFGEFTQLDLEMSFATQEEIISITENLFTKLIEKLCSDKKITQTPWPRLNYQDVIKEYGTDSPDLRKDKNDSNELAFAWIINFPLFTEQSKEDFFHGSGKSKWAPSHHMFTAPHPDDVQLLEKDAGKVRGMQHDFVLNGVEIGGGSIRIHDSEIQQKVFDLIGFSDEQKQQFAHLLEAFKYGVPPHGGIATGIDRILMILLGEPSLREVIAFPKTGDGRDLMMNSPSKITKAQLKELHIKIEKPKK